MRLAAVSDRYGLRWVRARTRARAVLPPLPPPLPLPAVFFLGAAAGRGGPAASSAAPPLGATGGGLGGGGGGRRCRRARPGAGGRASSWVAALPACHVYRAALVRLALSLASAWKSGLWYRCGGRANSGSSGAFFVYSCFHLHR